MSAPHMQQPSAMPYGRHGPPPVRPPSNGARAHSIVALSVIASLGTLSAFFAFFMGIFLADTCHAPGDLGCSNAFVGFMAVSSVPVVLLACVLAGVGIGRAREGGGHGFAVAAWCVWGGFCLVWHVLVALAST